MSYGDYVEQLTFLLFLKMADEQAKPAVNTPLRLGFGGADRPSPIPKGKDWQAQNKIQSMKSGPSAVKSHA